VDFLAGMTGKQRQRALQIGLGAGMLMIVILVEVLAISPAGIYSYTAKGYRAFKIDAPKQRILAEINQVPAIRTLITCDPLSRTALVTQRHFSYTKELDTADIWIARYRKNNVLIFLFQDQALVRILMLKTRFSRQISSPLFDTCRPDLHQDVDRFLKEQTEHPVFYH
jgi:hypothetical protein